MGNFKMMILILIFYSVMAGPRNVTYSTVVDNTTDDIYNLLEDIFLSKAPDPKHEIQVDITNWGLNTFKMDSTQFNMVFGVAAIMVLFFIIPNITREKKVPKKTIYQMANMTEEAENIVNQTYV